MDGDGRPPHSQYPPTHSFHLHYDPDQHQHQNQHQHQHQHQLQQSLPPAPSAPNPHHHHQHHPHPHHQSLQQPETHHPSATYHHPQLHPHPHPHPSLHDTGPWVYDYNPDPTSPPPAPPAYAWPQQQFVHALESSPDVARPLQSQFIEHPYQQQQQQQQQQPPPSFQSPRSEYYLSPTTPSPYAYHASPHPSAYPSPVSRSMSVSAVSNASIDQIATSQRQQPQSQSQNTFLPTPRQIRFVSTDGQPHAKRRRINAACLTCRKRKTRCSGERPICKTCTDNGHKCAGYAEKPSRKDADKKGEDGDDDDDGDSAPPSPGKQQQQQQQPPPPDFSASSHQDVSLSHPTSSSYRSGQTYAATEAGARNAAIDGHGDPKSPVSNYTVGSGSASAGRTRVPFFRYFGPTAIVPGFKQMVVQMKDGREPRRPPRSVSADSPIPGSLPEAGPGGVRALSPALVDLPYYDATDPSPNDPLIMALCGTFFDHLGCNYPFLQREQFLQDLAEKRVDAILVNAVCAVAARFSKDPILAKPSDDSLPLDHRGAVKRAFRGQPFAQRAMSAVIDTFSCPTLAVTQACLLLAYEEFGSDRDSGLWMYLGTSIRMAQDLGIQKLEGMQLEGRLGPTPKTAKSGHDGRAEEVKRAEQQRRLSQTVEHKNGASVEDRKASERERIDTFWAVFFLDRAVSSGVGRPVTLRDKDIEISFPYRSNETKVNGYPDPFPSMIRIVHMYGRVADVINHIKEVTEVTPETLKRLAGMEKDLTGIYQTMSPKLHFNATNFQHYVKAGQGTNFILLHFWFHTLIVLLHQPTLLHSFEGRIQQLFPDSRELSMSSAKTIADILAFAELIDVKSFIGNPFTSQPMYVAACAFLAEAAAHASQPPSRGDTPVQRHSRNGHRAEGNEAEQKMAAKHSLLASAANQNYQRCYKALKTLDSYWAGCRYILTALDQKSEGLTSPLLFTLEDVDGEMPSTEPSFTTPGWRRTSFGVSLGGPGFEKMRVGRSSSQEMPWSPRPDLGNAIGWSITGTSSSPAPNLSFLYQNTAGDADGAATAQLLQMNAGPHTASATAQAGQTPMQRFQTVRGFSSPSLLPSLRGKTSSLPYDPVSTAEADLLLGLHSPYSVTSSNNPSNTSNPQPPISSRARDFAPTQDPSLPPATNTPPTNFYHTPGQTNFSDMFIESQDIDMSNQQNFNLNNFGFLGGDMIPWLEYLPQDVLNYFADSGDLGLHASVNNTPHGDVILPSGPGPPPDPSALGSRPSGPPSFQSSHRRGPSDGGV